MGLRKFFRSRANLSRNLDLVLTGLKVREVLAIDRDFFDQQRLKPKALRNQNVQVLQ